MQIRLLKIWLRSSVEKWENPFQPICPTDTKTQKEEIVILCILSQQLLSEKLIINVFFSKIIENIVVKLNNTLYL